MESNSDTRLFQLKLNSLLASKKSSRRNSHIQVSLKHLFWVMLLTTVFLKLREYSLEPSLPITENEAVQLIERNGGLVDRSEKSIIIFQDDTALNAIVSIPETRILAFHHMARLRNLTNLKLLSELQEIKLFYSGDDETLEEIASLNRVTTLRVLSLDITERSIVSISRMTQLEHLCLLCNDCVKDTSFRHLSTLRNLKRLDVSGNLSFALFAYMGPLPKLETISVEGKGFADEELDVLNIFPSLERLGILDISNSSLTRSGIELAKKKHPKFPKIFTDECFGAFDFP